MKYEVYNERIEKARALVAIEESSVLQCKSNLNFARARLKQRTAGNSGQLKETVQGCEATLTEARSLLRKAKTSLINLENDKVSLGLG